MSFPREKDKKFFWGSRVIFPFHLIMGSVFSRIIWIRYSGCFYRCNTDLFFSTDHVLHINIFPVRFPPRLVKAFRGKTADNGISAVACKRIFPRGKISQVMPVQKGKYFFPE